MHYGALQGVRPTWLQWSQQAPQREGGTRTGTRRRELQPGATYQRLRRDLLPWRCTLTHTHTHEQVQYSNLVFPFSTQGEGPCFSIQAIMSPWLLAYGLLVQKVTRKGAKHFLVGTQQNVRVAPRWRKKKKKNKRVLPGLEPI